jgi:nitrogen fixation NifU-like protein
MSDVRSLYSDKVMEHFRNPRNVGEIKNPDGTGHVGNSVCGDIMDLYIKVNDSTIVDAKFKTFGCGAAIATSSMVTEMVKGKSIAEALKISNQAVAQALDGLPPAKMHCSVLAEEALKSAIDDYLSKSKKEDDPRPS